MPGRGLATRRIRRLAGGVLAASPLSPAVAPAALAMPEPLVPRGSSQSGPPAVVSTADGVRWVADEIPGV